MAEENQQGGTTNVSDSAIHQEGIDHIKGNSEAGSAQPPASNPGSDDPSGGIGKDNGGVSGSAYIGSPVPSEEKSGGVVQSTVDSVKGYLAGLSLGGGSTAAKDADAQARDAEQREEQQTSSSSSGGVVAGAAATASAATAAVVGSNYGEKKEEETRPQDTAATTSDAAATTSDIAAPASDSPAKKSESAVNDESTADSVPKEQPSKIDDVSGQDATKQSSVKGTKGGKENRDAIPTAGGEKLGEKHWGESQTIPDNPKPQPTENVSSAEGQPDSLTKDNTQSNTGGAAPPGGSSNSADNGEEKQSFTDKIKDKLNMGKKE